MFKKNTLSAFDLLSTYKTLQKGSEALTPSGIIYEHDYPSIFSTTHATETIYTNNGSTPVIITDFLFMFYGSSTGYVLTGSSQTLQLFINGLSFPNSFSISTSDRNGLCTNFALLNTGEPSSSKTDTIVRKAVLPTYPVQFSLGTNTNTETAMKVILFGFTL